MDHRLISRFVAYFVQGFLRNAGPEQQLVSRLAFFVRLAQPAVFIVCAQQFVDLPQSRMPVTWTRDIPRDARPCRRVPD